MNHRVRLYNVLFPFWMLMMFPVMWLIILPGNFLIDSIVLIIAMTCLKIQERKAFYKKHIFAVFGSGILSDIVGSAYMLILMVCLEVGRMGDEIYLTLPAVLISAVCIFILNYFVTFRACDMPIRLTLALTFAIVTAPYTFMVPSSWLYG